jgi:hybrid polyketide synthase/nonribosomal peptide synthetase ACE1
MLSELRGLGLSHDVKLLNSYGPVEGTIIATKMLLPVHQDNEGKPIPVGLPLPNYSIYIVDEDLNLLPPEVPGEIIIGGQGVAIGYLDDDGKKFIANPWADAEYIKRGWSKMYRTGDKGHLTKRGELIFHGRIAGDTQVKLRGIRLELEDVERNILKAANGDLSEVVCTIREGADGAGSNYLVAFVVLSSQADGASAESDYLTNLRERLPLPQYMKPSAMVVLKTLPLTKHGKIDRSAIGAMSLTTNVAGEGQDEAELSELEVQISNIWRQLLPKETMPPSLKRSSDFFMVGGSSLVLVEVQSLVRTEFNIDLSLRDLYEATALSEMADKVREALNAKTINWALETAPPQPHELAELSGPSQPLRSTNLEVIMTGATGHLGGFVLQRLISDPAIAKIHCVAVRDASGLKFHSDKLVIYSGDLSQPNLGLPADTAAYLAATADAVVHSGATRLNWETYESMRPTNLLSTRTLIRLAAPRRLPVHFVSSGGVFPADVAPSEDSAAEHQPPAVGADGYVASKWASERLLERSAEQLGVPVHIYRTVRADEGTFPEELPEEILAGMAAATVEAGVMLDHGGHAWVGFFDLVSAPGVADNIVRGVVAEAASQNVGGEERGGGNRGTVGYANHKGIYRVWKGEQLDSLVYRPEIQERLGRFKMVPPQIWLGEMKRAGFPWMMGASAAAYKGLVKNRR